MAKDFSVFVNKGGKTLLRMVCYILSNQKGSLKATLLVKHLAWPQSLVIMDEQMRGNVEDSQIVCTTFLKDDGYLPKYTNSRICIDSREWERKPV